MNENRIRGKEAWLVVSLPYGCVMLPKDAKLGLVVGMCLVILLTVIFMRRDFDENTNRDSAPPPAARGAVMRPIRSSLATHVLPTRTPSDRVLPSPSETAQAKQNAPATLP